MTSVILFELCYFRIANVITPEIKPIIEPKTRSFKRFRDMRNSPSNIEKVRNANIVYNAPIISPQSQPLDLIFLLAIKQPNKILSTFIT